MTLNTVLLDDLLNGETLDDPTAKTAVDPDLTPVVLLHGFTQNVQCWGGFDAALKRCLPGRLVVAVDAPGHGQSGHDDADLVRTADLLVDALEARGVTRAVWLGYSMGGRTGLHLAVFRPSRVAGLVLIGASPGLADSHERQTRRMADDRLADQLLADGLDVFLDRWLASPLFAGLSPDATAKPARLTNRAAGLAASLRHCGTGVQENLWPRLAQVHCPTLLVHGSGDAKFARIAQRMAAELTRAGHSRSSPPERSASAATVASVPGTHAVHLEQAELVAGQVAEFLARHGL